MILQCSHIDKGFQGDSLLKDISFHINDNEKTALVGINGSGKTTLLKILAGEYSPDNGEVIIPRDITVGYLAQNPIYDSDRSILEEMQEARKELIQLEHDMNTLSAEIDCAQGDHLEALVRQYDNMRRRFESMDGYAYQSELTGVLKGLGFCEEDFDKPVASLSGGEKTRVALGKMLLQSPQLILLDEPTNHLDTNAIHWLETYLSSYSGAALIVSHDRYFLDKIVTKVVELRQGHAATYQGNYSAFSQKKQAVLEAELKQYQNQQSQIRHQEEVITKLRSFNREKSIKRAESREKQLEKMERLEKPVEERTRMNLLFSPRIQSGNDVLRAEGLTKGFDSRILFQNVSFELKRGEHVAIIGDNGSGKTTLLKLITQLLPPDAGEIRLGVNVEIGYYDQAHQVLHEEKTIFQEIQDEHPHMTNTQVRNLLASFLFTEDDVFKQIRNLSGGERGRVSLAKLMLSDANLLILDEPTNHLDIDSKEILERAVRQFEGTILYVSHDRYFINRTASRILDLTRGQLVNYIGNYDYYLEKKADVEKAQFASSQEEGSAPSQSRTKMDWQQQKAEQAKQRKRENALKKVEEEIEQLETEVQELDTGLSDPANGTNVALLQELAGQKAEKEERLSQLMEQWEELSE